MLWITKNKVNYIEAVNFINLFLRQQNEWTSKNEGESRKSGLCDSFGCILVAEFQLYWTKMHSRYYSRSCVNH